MSQIQDAAPLDGKQEGETQLGVIQVVTKERTGAVEAVEQGVAMEAEAGGRAGEVAIAGEEDLEGFDQLSAETLFGEQGREGALDERGEVAAVAQGKEEPVDAKLGGASDAAGAEDEMAETGGVAGLGGGAMNLARRGGGIAEAAGPRGSRGAVAQGACE